MLESLLDEFEVSEGFDPLDEEVLVELLFESLLEVFPELLSELFLEVLFESEFPLCLLCERLELEPELLLLLFVLFESLEFESSELSDDKEVSDSSEL